MTHTHTSTFIVNSEQVVSVTFPKYYLLMESFGICNGVISLRNEQLAGGQRRMRKILTSSAITNQKCSKTNC